MLNTKGGEILFGVEDDKHLSGTDLKEKNWEEWIANICRDHIQPPVVDVKVELASVEGKDILIITVPRGKDKPYQDKKNHFLVRGLVLPIE